MVKHVVRLVAAVVSFVLGVPAVLELIGVAAACSWAGATWGPRGVAAVIAVAAFVKAAEADAAPAEPDR